jgi:hypothetical protein
MYIFYIIHFDEYSMFVHLCVTASLIKIRYYIILRRSEKKNNNIDKKKSSSLGQYVIHYLTFFCIHFFLTPLEHNIIYLFLSIVSCNYSNICMSTSYIQPIYYYLWGRNWVRLYITRNDGFSQIFHTIVRSEFGSRRFIIIRFLYVLFGPRACNIYN